MSEEKPMKDDESVLFPEEEIGGVTVRPWSFGVLFDIAPSLEIVLDKIDEAKLFEKIESSEGFITWPLMARIFTIAGPEVLKIISLTIEKPLEEVKKFDMDTGMKIAVCIYNQNKDRIFNALKNVFGPPN